MNNGASTELGLRFVAVGQSLIKRDVRAFLNEHSRELVELIQSADVAFTNFEGTIWGTQGCWPMKNANRGRDPVVNRSCGCDPVVLDSIQAMGFTMLSLANNHSFDLGPGGILATLAEVESRGFLHAGIGADYTQATQFGWTESKRGNVAIVAMDGCSQPDMVYAADSDGTFPARPGLNRQLFESGVPDSGDRVRNLSEISKAAVQARFVVAYIHHHYQTAESGLPPEYVQNFSRQCIDAGANVVLWDGSPRMRGIEIHQKRPIFYGCSNFIFHTYMPDHWYQSVGDQAWRTFLGDCEFDSDGNLTRLGIVPVWTGGGGDISARDGSAPAYRDAPVIADPEMGDEILSRLIQLSSGLGTKIDIKDGRGSVAV